MIKLDQKSFLITGSNGRIGSMATQVAIKQGFYPILLDSKPPTADNINELIDNNGAIFNVCDVTNPRELESCLKKLNTEITVALHAAYPRSSGFGTKFEDLKIENLKTDLTLQLGGAILFSQAIMKLFRQQGHGNLIHVSSIQGVMPPKFEHYQFTDMVSPIEYSAIKAGVISITKYLAKYYKDCGIRVNCISPGGILDNQPSRFLKEYRKSCNSKGMLEVNDLSGIVSFLISDLSETITGQNFIIDDGWSL